MIDKVRVIKENFLKLLDKVTFNNLSTAQLINVKHHIDCVTKAITELEALSTPKVDKKNKLENKNGKPS